MSPVEALAKAAAGINQKEWDAYEPWQRQNCLHDAASEIERLRAAGFALVPLEPTEAMCRSAKWALDRAKEQIPGKLQDPRPFTAEEKHAIRYRAMLAAAEDKGEMG